MVIWERNGRKYSNSVVSIRQDRKIKILLHNAKIEDNEGRRANGM